MLPGGHGPTFHWDRWLWCVERHAPAAEQRVLSLLELEGSASAQVGEHVRAAGAVFFQAVFGIRGEPTQEQTIKEAEFRSNQGRTDLHKCIQELRAVIGPQLLNASVGRTDLADAP
jgi:hypothetical protein